MRQMIAVASMDNHTLNAFPVEFAGRRAGAMVLARSLHLFEKLVLQFGCFFPFPLLEQFHRLHF
jgi:ABC-type microcin C transport system duplicated ATPase subunit YejF